MLIAFVAPQCLLGVQSLPVHNKCMYGFITIWSNVMKYISLNKHPVLLAVSDWHFDLSHPMITASK